MIGVGIGVRVGGMTIVGGGGFDTDAQAFFDRVTTAGGTLTTTEKNATNTLVLDMKSAGIWTSMKAVYPMVGASAAACAQNLKSSSFTGTFNGGWTFASTGATPNGSNGYMDTGLNQSANLGVSNNHISFYSRTDFNSSLSYNGQICGITNNINYSFQVIIPRGSGQQTLEMGSQIVNSTSANSLGLYIGSTTSSTSAKFYKNNTIVGSSTTAQTRALFNNNVYIGATNESTSNSAVWFSPRQCAFSSIGDGLTDTQASNFYTAVNSFQVSLSRNV